MLIFEFAGLAWAAAVGLVEDKEEDEDEDEAVGATGVEALAGVVDDVQAAEPGATAVAVWTRAGRDVDLDVDVEVEVGAEAATV